MNRLGLLDPNSLSAEQKELYDELADYTTARYGSTYVAFTPISSSAKKANFNVQLLNPRQGWTVFGTRMSFPSHRLLSI